MTGAVMLSGKSTKSTRCPAGGFADAAHHAAHQLHALGDEVRRVGHVVAEVLDVHPLDPELLEGRAGEGDEGNAVFAQLAPVAQDTRGVREHDGVAEVGHQRGVVGRLLHVAHGGAPDVPPGLRSCSW